MRIYQFLRVLLTIYMTLGLTQLLLPVLDQNLILHKIMITLSTTRICRPLILHLNSMILLMISILQAFHHLCSFMMGLIILRILPIFLQHPQVIHPKTTIPFHLHKIIILHLPMITILMKLPLTPHFQSAPSFTENNLPSFPLNYTCYQSSDASYPSQSSAQHSPSSRNGIVLEPNPSAQTYQYDSNYQPTPEKLQRHTKLQDLLLGHWHSMICQLQLIT
ncbi:unnamed protein product [Lupinus luteus]|uniref:Uncharacterized protein n=1 Tax=Lupinus luteus TaxID=3873 RepID=A0AAV1Y5Z4_LUPLU